MIKVLNTPKRETALKNYCYPINLRISQMYEFMQYIKNSYLHINFSCPKMLKNRETWIL